MTTTTLRRPCILRRHWDAGDLPWMGPRAIIILRRGDSAVNPHSATHPYWGPCTVTYRHDWTTGIISAAATR